MRCRVCITSHDFRVQGGSACGRGTWQVACLCVAPRVVSGSAPALVHSLLARAKWLISGACTVHQAARSRVWHHPLFCLFEGLTTPSRRHHLFMSTQTALRLPAKTVSGAIMGKRARQASASPCKALGPHDLETANDWARHAGRVLSSTDTAALSTLAENLAAGVWLTTHSSRIGTEGAIPYIIDAARKQGIAVPALQSGSYDDTGGSMSTARRTSIPTAARCCSTTTLRPPLHNTCLAISMIAYLPSCVDAWTDFSSASKCG